MYNGYMSNNNLPWFSSLLKTPTTFQVAEPLLHSELTRRHQLSPHYWKPTPAAAQVYDLHEQAIDGNIESIYLLSEHYQTGNEVPQDLYLAFRLVCYAAEQGYTQAFAALGKYLADGIGTWGFMVD